MICSRDVTMARHDSFNRRIRLGDVVFFWDFNP